MNTAGKATNALLHIIVLALALYANPGFAQTQISVYHLQGLHTQNQDGAYDQLMQAMRKRGIANSLKFSPIVRAKHLFNTGKIDCLCPADAADWFYPFATVQSEPINYAKAFIFTRKQDPVISSISQLKGLAIGVRTGMNFNDGFEEIKNDINFDIEEVRDIELNYKKLMAGRIDAFVAYAPDIWNTLTEEQSNTLAFDRSKPFFVHPESVVCHDTPENQVFIKQFNHELNTLKAQGELKRILGKSYTLE